MISLKWPCQWKYDIIVMDISRRNRHKWLITGWRINIKVNLWICPFKKINGIIR